MSTTKLIQTEKPHKYQLASGNWFLKNWHFVLPEDGTLVPKHGGDVPLIFILIKTAFSVINGVVLTHNNFCISVLPPPNL
jgi:hypothetical protein